MTSILLGFKSPLCHSYQLSPSNQASQTIFDNPMLDIERGGKREGAVIAIPRPSACKLADMVEQTGWYNFSLKGKKKKENSSLSNQVNNSPFCKKCAVCLMNAG